MHPAVDEQDTSRRAGAVGGDGHVPQADAQGRARPARTGDYGKMCRRCGGDGQVRKAAAPSSGLDDAQGRNLAEHISARVALHHQQHVTKASRSQETDGSRVQQRRKGIHVGVAGRHTGGSCRKVPPGNVGTETGCASNSGEHRSPGTAPPIVTEAEKAKGRL